MAAQPPIQAPTPKIGRFVQLREVLLHLADVPEEEWRAFCAIFRPSQVERHAFLALEGEVHRQCYFISKGLLRFFYTTPDGKEFNKSFIMENQFAGSLRSSLHPVPIRYSIQALEDTEFLVTETETLRSFYDRHQCWERVGRIIAERLALKKEQRECAFLLDSAATRYRTFLANFPGLDERLPQYHIASYLGITDVALSRIRRRIRESQSNICTI